MAWMLLVAKSVSESERTTDSSCGVYLAESTIPGAGLGMFAGKSYAKEEKVTDGDIVIPLIEIDWHNGDEDWVFLWDDYQWAASEFVGMTQEVEGESIAGASPGIGAAINCILSLVNIEESYTKIDNAGLHRSRDAGAGAFTPYHDRLSYATENIPAGQELFISYGTNYFETRKRIYGPMPTGFDCKRADHVIAKYQNLFSEDTSQDLKRDVWKLVTSLPEWNEDVSRIGIAFPEKFEEIEYFAEVGTAKRYYNRSIRMSIGLRRMASASTISELAFLRSHRPVAEPLQHASFPRVDLLPLLP